MIMSRACACLAFAWAWLLLGVASGAGHDTYTSLPESQWFVPGDHATEISQFIGSWRGEQRIDALDMFGFSRGIQRVWEHHGYVGAALDVGLGGNSHDLLSEEGFYVWLDHLMQMRHGGICVAGPPCSLWIFISAGTHKRGRHGNGIRGDISLKCVRTANCILRNFAALLRYIHEIRQLIFVIEQPISSQMFRTPEMEYLKGIWSLVTVSTWLGLFGHILMKGTKLLTNLPETGGLSRKMTRARRQAIKRRQERAMQAARRRGKSLCYYRRDKEGRVSGGKDLSSTSSYPKKFCTEIFKLWSAALTQAPPIPVQIIESSSSSSSEPEHDETYEIQTINSSQG